MMEHKNRGTNEGEGDNTKHDKLTKNQVLLVHHLNLED